MTALLWITAAWYAFGALVLLARPRKDADWAHGVGFAIAMLLNIGTVAVVVIAALRGVR